MVYKIVFIFLKLLSRLPFWCLHRISDFFYLLLFYVIRYRKKVILNNLIIAFPNHSLEENKNGKDDNLTIDLFASKIVGSTSRVRVLHSVDFPPLHHPEITTPPPELFISLT